MAYQITRRGENLRKGPWFEEEDETLTAAVAVLGEKRWDALAKASGLRRSGKSCRLRWLNYLRPNLKHGEITEEEELIIVELHKHWGNKWAKIARRLPGRTDNEIKNYWRTHLKKRSIQVQEEQEEFSSATSNARKDVFVPVCDQGITRITTDIENSHYGNSDDSSCAVNELSNISFGSSPYETRVSDWMSSCLSYEQSEMERHHSHGWDPLGLDSSFCYPSWSFEEERDESIWDCSSSFWS